MVLLSHKERREGQLFGCMRLVIIAESFLLCFPSTTRINSRSSCMFPVLLVMLCKQNLQLNPICGSLLTATHRSNNWTSFGGKETLLCGALHLRCCCSWQSSKRSHSTRNIQTFGNPVPHKYEHTHGSLWPDAPSPEDPSANLYYLLIQ